MIKKRINILIVLFSKKLGLDLAYFIKNFTYLSTAQFTAQVFSFLLAIVLARYATKVMVGHYTYLQSVFGLFGIIGLTGMGTAVTRAAAYRKSEVFPQAVVLSFLIGLLGTIGLMIVAWFFSDKSFFNALVLMSIIFPIYSATAYYVPYLQGMKKFLLASILSIFPSILTSILIIILVLSNKYSLASLVGAYLIPATVLGVISSFLMWKYLNYVKFTSNWSSDIKYGIQLSGIEYLSIVGGYLDKVLIGILLPPHQLAIYTYALATTEIVKSYSKNLLYLVMPKIASISYFDYSRQILKNKWFLIISTLLLIISYWFISPYVYNWVFPTYRESIQMSRVLSLSLITIPTFLFLGWFQVNKSNTNMIKTNLIYLTSQILLLLLLTSQFGIWGAVWARVLSRIIGGLYSGWLFFKGEGSAVS